MVVIDSKAEVEKGAELDDNVEIGAFSYIGKNVRIKKNTKIFPHSLITGKTEIGENNKIYSFVSIGTPPQDIGYKGEPHRVIIGDNNIIRGYTSINIGTTKGGGLTKIGDNNYFMLYSHIAHDCEIGNNIIMTNGATLGGHTIIEDYAILSAFVGVHQFVRIGKFSFLGGYAVITQDVPPFARVVGTRPAYIVDVNSIGMRRNGISKETVALIKESFKILFRSGLNTTDALEKIEKELEKDIELTHLINFIKNSKRGIIKKIRDKWER
jgi:UDP-N-acetylglucosamine acyltransferase